MVCASAQVPPANQIVGRDEIDPDVLLQMREMGRQMQQRMEERGIDRRQLVDELLLDMRQGVDTATLQQRLISRGVIDREALEQLHALGQRIALGSIRRRLASDDAQWNIVAARMQKVVAALADHGHFIDTPREQESRTATFEGMLLTPAPALEIVQAANALRDTLKDAQSPPAKISAQLQTYRSLRAKARSALEEAREDLRRILTLRQEAILLQLGILD
jgi:hypothetical protein